MSLFMGDQIENCGKRHQAAQEESEDPAHARYPPRPLDDTDEGDYQAGESQRTSEEYRRKRDWRESDLDAEQDRDH